jgi:hypothetical protein
MFFLRIRFRRLVPSPDPLFNDLHVLLMNAPQA